MIKKAILLMCFAGVGVNAQVITQNFVTGANAFSIDFVEIGNPGNLPLNGTYPINPFSPDPPSGRAFSNGSVGYIYNLGKYEISRDSITKANSIGNLGLTLFDGSEYGGNGSFKPATGINWFEAAKFVNWLNTSTGSQEAYKFDEFGNFRLWENGDIGYQANNPFRNSLAKYVLPTKDEWYKGAFYDPLKTAAGGYWRFATGSDDIPVSVAGGTTAGTAVYNLTYGQGPADVDNAGGLSPYGTMGQGGNAIEWTESATDGDNSQIYEDRELRGDTWWGGYPVDGYIAAEKLGSGPPGDQWNPTGFRVAMVPEPSALSLLAVGLGGLAMMRRRLS